MWLSRSHGAATGESCGRAVPCRGQRVDHSRRVYVVPDDLPQRLLRFMEEADMSQAELARRLGTYPYTVKRWTKNGVRPYYQYQMALLDLADDLGLAHLLTMWTLPDEAGAGSLPRPPAPRHQQCAALMACRTPTGGRDQVKNQTEAISVQCCYFGALMPVTSPGPSL